MSFSVGQKVVTFTDKRFVSTGVITTLSGCGRYAVVEKTYGEHCRFRKHYLVKELREVKPKKP